MLILIALKKRKVQTEHFCFPFKTTTLNDLLSFSIYLIDDDNKPIEFVSRENKISTLNVFSKWIENVDWQNLHAQQIKDEQIALMLREIENDTEKLKIALNDKNKQLIDLEKLLKGCKKWISKSCKRKQTIKIIYNNK